MFFKEGSKKHLKIKEINEKSYTSILKMIKCISVKLAFILFGFNNSLL